jgi:hypothetical protein
MAWDPALLRKYNTTGHFRLLNQLRGELKDQPIQRPLVTSRSAAAGSAGGGGGSRRGSGRSGSGSGSSSSGAASTPAASQSSSHAVTRRRGGSSAVAVSLAPSAHDAQQPFMTVPVLTDVVMPDSHTGS